MKNALSLAVIEFKLFFTTYDQIVIFTVFEYFRAVEYLTDTL